MNQDNLQSELQNVWEQSQLELKGQIEELKHLGRYLVVESFAVFCKRTDALLGNKIVLIGDYATKQEAEDAVNGEFLGEYNERCIEIVYPIFPSQSPLEPLTDEQIPF